MPGSVSIISDSSPPTSWPACRATYTVNPTVPIGWDLILWDKVPALHFEASDRVSHSDSEESSLDGVSRAGVSAWRISLGSAVMLAARRVSSCNPPTD